MKNIINQGDKEMFKVRRKMVEYSKKSEHIGIMISFFKWLINGSIVGVLCGLASALFLYMLNSVTELREMNLWIILFLPVAGAFTTLLYLKYGKNSSRGNNLILEEIQNKKDKIPFRMGVLILISSIISHLFGASVGREGTAVQMGGSLSELTAKIFKSNERDRRILLMSGISGGFGSVFGTPLAGTIFGMEVSSMGAIKYESLIPCFTASFVGNIVTRTLITDDYKYNIGIIPEMTASVIIKVLIASLIFGLAAILFSESMHRTKRIFTKYIKNPIIRPVIGGLLIVGVTFITGTTIYNGTGNMTIEESFVKTVPKEAFLGKIVYTALSLGSGFHGGEVTPIFYTGATLGNLLAEIMNMPLAFFAALGMIAVFSGASNAPIACFVLGMELFGAKAGVYFFMASIVSYMFSGHHGIYTSQMVATAKSKLLNYQEGKKIGSVKDKK